MRIAAALCWFDETPETLHRCISSLAGVVDVVVALDGRWEMFPGERNVSPVEQGLALHDAAMGAGLELVASACSSRRPWRSQVEKRDALMQLASRRADWILVIDADEFVVASDRAQLDRLLGGDVAAIPIRRQGTGVFQKGRRLRRRLYRAAARLSVVGAHNGYQAEDGRWLNGDADHVELAPATDASSGIELVHDRDARPVERQERASFYYRVRGLLGAEEWAT